MKARVGPDYLLEKACPAPVCGVDEAGRGPWAGPVSAGAVILDPKKRIKGLDDSKKLSAKQREALEVEIKAKALSWGVGFASVAEIAELNILPATGLAMCRAVEALHIKPVFALVDGGAVKLILLSLAEAMVIQILLSGYLASAFELLLPDGRPNILRLYGRGEVVTFDDPGYEDMLALFPGFSRARAVIRISLTRIADACGWAVPTYEYKGDRDQLRRYIDQHTEEAWREKRRTNNALSIDGLPGLVRPK